MLYPKEISSVVLLRMLPLSKYGKLLYLHIRHRRKYDRLLLFFLKRVLKYCKIFFFINIVCYFLDLFFEFQNNWAVEDEYIALIIDWQGKHLMKSHKVHSLLETVFNKILPKWHFLLFFIILYPHFTYNLSST